MNKSINVAKLVRQAQKGHKESLESLGTHVRQRVMVYLYRMTLDYHLTQDLTQETMLTVIKSLHHLKTNSQSSLWAWIYRTALGKVQHYYHKQGKQKLNRHTTMDQDALDQIAAHPAMDGLDCAERRELIDAMTTSMKALKMTYRHVLVLRCFEQLSYADIATALGTGSELQMRLLFFRAKKALKRQLHNRGFGRQYFLSGLTVFAIMTSLRTKSMATVPAVTAGLVKTGTIATTIGMVTTQGGLALIAFLTLTLIVGSSFLPESEPQIPNVNNPTPWDFPSRIINNYNPNDNGWERLIPNDNGPDIRQPFDLMTIVNQPGKWFFLILPENHWIEFGFPGTIMNGPGPDIQFFCLKTDHLPRIFLTDGDQQTYRLENPNRVLLINWIYRVEFDLDGLECPFIPTAIRIVGHGPPTQPTIIRTDIKALIKRMD